MENVVTASAGAGSWKGRRVFLTGHTGFKGGWLALWLASRGAVVRGYGLDPATSPNLFHEARIDNVIEDVRGDIRDAGTLYPALREFAPEVVFHLAAQPLVRASYADPIATYESNVIGTARVLDAVRQAPTVRAVICVTTDKCYENREWVWGYRESDPLGGYDPYSSSKACAELVTAAFRQSYFPAEMYPDHGVAIATARAGNVLGGGDWATDRLLPDLVRGLQNGAAVAIRNPSSVRPWQHVLEPLHGYLTLADKLLSADAVRYATAFNFGPAEDDAKPVSWIAEHMVRSWGDGTSWFKDGDASLHEAGVLKLDTSRARAELGWIPRMPLSVALDWLVQWYKAQQRGADMHAYTIAQIDDYEALSH